jgi:hypothetical protein
MSISVTHTVYRDDVEIKVTATGKFYQGEIESWSHDSTPPVDLTTDENDEIVGKLIDAHGDDWDEESWKADRERA